MAFDDQIASLSTASASTFVSAPGLQRAVGRAAADFRFADGKTRLARLHQSGCLKLRFPRLHQVDGGDGAEAILINSSGGVTGGDRLSQNYVLGAGASLCATTQACERVYRASEGEARIETQVEVGEEASFAYLPQETILFDGGALARSLSIDCAASSRLLLVESVVLGRTLMGETVRTGRFHDRWRIRRDGRLVHAEDLRFSGAIDALAGQAASLGGAKAFATVLCQRPDAEGDLAGVRAIVGASGGASGSTSGGASAFDGLLLVRLVAADGFALRKRLVPLLSLLAKRALPRVWSI